MNRLIAPLLMLLLISINTYGAETIISPTSESLSPINGLTIDFTVTKASCGNSDGEIEFNISGGTPPYTFTPSNTTNLAAGSYSYSITDSGTCSEEVTVNVSEDNSLSTFVDVLDDIDCSGNATTEAYINISGGSGQYLVLIDEDPPVSEISPGLFSTIVGGGTFGITITDINDDCTLIDNFAVGQPSPIDIDATILEIDSCSGRILLVDFTVVGGTPPYESEVFPGNLGVEIMVTDSEGCVEVLFVPNPVIEDGLVITEILVYHPDSGDDNGSVDITVEGGQPPYFYLWEDSDGNELSTDEDIDDLEAGTYVVYVSDSKSCNILSGDIVLESPSSNDEVQIKAYNIYPNPSSQGFVIIDGPVSKDIQVEILTVDGRRVHYMQSVQNRQRIDLNGMQSGIYYLKLIYEDGRYEMHSLVVE